MTPAQPTHAPAAATAATAASRARAWLKRQPKRHLALFALVPVLVVVWLPILAGRRDPGAVAARLPAADAATGAAPAAAAAAPAGETSPTSLAAATIAATAAFEQRLRELAHPFQPRSTASVLPAPPPAEPAPRRDPTPASYSSLVPSAILLSRGGEAVAIVQGRPCRVGDVVAGSTIVAIEERRVVYREGGRTVAADMASTAIGGER